MAQAYFHLVPAAEWQEAKQSGEPYVPRTYESDGTHRTLELAPAGVPCAPAGGHSGTVRDGATL